LSIRITVIGAGAFGGWTALELARRGVAVTLIDAWGPGNLRASSGGETRIIRASYGSRAIYTRMARRALDRWRAHAKRSRFRLLYETGVLWMCGEDDGFARASAAALKDEGLAFDEVPLNRAQRQYPQINFAGIASVYIEPAAGYLLARRACEEIASEVTANGGVYRQAAVRSPVDLEEVAAGRLTLHDGTALEADAFVFACGPWLGTLFPDAIGSHILPTRQDVYYFGVPGGDTQFSDGQLPVWIDLSRGQIYGVPASGAAGFKVADDASGPSIDPTTVDRQVSPDGIAASRQFLARRFPALAGAPLVAGEVCQYESTPDSHLILDRHPQAPNLWIAGGGSGHGFKMGPAIGEMLAAHILDAAPIEPQFALARLTGMSHGGGLEKWM
jgi:glycine/D-amino acid oxidase-like deaminating enzyme